MKVAMPDAMGSNYTVYATQFSIIVQFLTSLFSGLVFTARRYALARSLLSSGVRPSVCLSVRHVGVLYPVG